jgi:hypothetical protein
VVSLLQPTLQSVQLLRRNPPIYPAAILHTPTWLFGVKEATVSTSFILLSPFWFFNWKTPRYHILLCRNPWLFNQIPPCFCRSLIQRAPTNTPAQAGPSITELYSFTTFLRENIPLYPSFALLSPCVAERF